MDAVLIAPDAAKQEFLCSSSTELENHSTSLSNRARISAVDDFRSSGVLIEYPYREEIMGRVGLAEFGTLILTPAGIHPQEL